MNAVRQFTGRISIRFALIVPYTALIVATASLGGLLFVSANNKIVDDLVTERQTNILDKTSAKLDRFFEKPRLLTAVIQRELEVDPSLLDDLPKLRVRILADLQNFDSVMSGGVGTGTTGSYVTAGRHDGGGFDSAIFDPKENPYYRFNLMDDHGQPGALLTQTKNYDARTRPWYQAAVAAGKSTWSPVYTFASKSSIGITAVLPLYGPGNKLNGVVQSGLALDAIGQFLKSITIEGRHRVFIMERSGELIGTSVGGVFTAMDDRSAPKRVNIENCADPIISGARRFLIGIPAMQPAGAGRQEKWTTHAEFKVDDSDFVLRAEPYSDEHGIDWVIAVVNERKDFTKIADEGTRSSVILSIVATLLTILIGLFIVGRITRPISKLNREIGNFTKAKIFSGVALEGPREIQELGQSFSVMAAEIGDLLSNLEAKVAERTKDLSDALEKIKDLSMLDPLTGCYNRRYLEQQLPKLVSAHQRFERAFSVIMCDIDHFKNVNDEFGHAVGDRVITEISACLLSHCRQQIDWIVRYGGEEFVLILPETEHAQAMNLAERLRVLTSEIEFTVEDATFHTTVSFGVATLQSSDDIQNLLKVADDRLYLAKKGGRNQVIGEG